MLLDRRIDSNNGGISLSIHDHYSTPLEAAAFNSNLPVVRLLIERGADVNKRGSNYTTLSRAVAKEDEQMVLYHLQNGARDSSCSTRSMCPSSAAAYKDVSPPSPNPSGSAPSSRSCSTTGVRPTLVIRQKSAGYLLKICGTSARASAAR